MMSLRGFSRVLDSGFTSSDLSDLFVSGAGFVKGRTKPKIWHLLEIVRWGEIAFRGECYHRLGGGKWHIVTTSSCRRVTKAQKWGNFCPQQQELYRLGWGAQETTRGVFLDIMKGIWAEHGQDDFMGRLDEAKCW